MSQVRTQLLQTYVNGFLHWVDNTTSGQETVDLFFDTYSGGQSGWRIKEYDSNRNLISNEKNTDNIADVKIWTLGEAAGDTTDIPSGIYTFAEGKPNRFQTPDIGPEPVVQDELPWFQTEAGVKHLLLTAASVSGTTDQIVVTENTDGSLTFSLSPNLAFEALHVLGDATVDGTLSAASVTSTGSVSGSSLSTTGTVTADSVNATGSVTASSVASTGTVTADTVTATAKVSAGYLSVDVYEAGQTPPTPPAGKAVFFAQKVA